MSDEASSEPTKEEILAQARALQEQAAALMRLAGVENEAAVSEVVATPTPSGASGEGDEPVTETAAEPVTGLPDDDEEAKIDPPEKMDMKEQLVQVRDLLTRKGFHKKASQADAEVWERPGPRGEPGFRATFVTTPHGRIRLEIRNPVGMIVTQAEPATLVDSEIALQQVP